MSERAGGDQELGDYVLGEAGEQRAAFELELERIQSFVNGFAGSRPSAARSPTCRVPRGRWRFRSRHRNGPRSRLSVRDRAFYVAALGVSPSPGLPRSRPVRRRYRGGNADRQRRRRDGAPHGDAVALAPLPGGPTDVSGDAYSNGEKRMVLIVHRLPADDRRAAITRHG